MNIGQLENNHPDSLDHFRLLVNRTTFEPEAVTHHELEVLAVIGGYAVHKLKPRLSSCEECRDLFDHGRPLSVTENETYEYLMTIDRGGLTYPTRDVVRVVDSVYRIITCLTKQDEGKNFRVATGQLFILENISFEYFCAQRPAGSEKCKSCGCELDLFWKKLIRTVSKILLSNYCKRSDDAELNKQRNMAQAKRDNKRSRNSNP